MYIVISILLYALAVASHEGAHALMCAILKCRVLGWGVIFLRRDAKGLRVGFPVPNHCAFAADSARKARIIAAAGPVNDMVYIIFAIALGAIGRSPWPFVCAAVLLATLVYNLLPPTGGDGRLIFSKETNSKETNSKET